MIGGKPMKEFTSSLSPKGQITLPIEVRRLLGIGPKDKVRIRLEDGEVKIAPAKPDIEASLAVPALNVRRTLAEMTAIAQEDQAQEAASEGCGGR